jgi:hypothetical protein
MIEKNLVKRKKKNIRELRIGVGRFFFFGCLKNSRACDLAELSASRNKRKKSLAAAQFPPKGRSRN